MVENSPDLVKKGSKRTTKTLPLTHAETLEILTQVFYEWEKASGTQADVEEPEPGVVVVRLRGVTFNDGLLIPYTGGSQEEKL